MIREAAKIGLIGALAVMFGRALYSLIVLMAAVIGATVLLGCIAAWYYISTNMGLSLIHI